MGGSVGTCAWFNSLDDLFFYGAQDDYLIKAFGPHPRHVLKSKSNHFMYWSAKSNHNEGYR